MKTINIKGKPYVMVNERIKEFRATHEDWSLLTEIIKLEADSCVIMAKVVDDKGIVRATGIAQEDRSSSTINKTSFVENAETSAWGRALGNLGIGIDDSIASAEEVAIAISKQINSETIVGGDYVMQNGKHVGEQIRDIPADYLDWYLEKGYDDTIKANIKKFREDIKEVEV